MNLASLDLNLLRVFDAVYTHRNVSAAAAALAISQPAVSNALKRLRREFADELFTRSPQGMNPTPAADRAAATVAQALALLREGLEPGPVFDAAHSRRRFTLIMSDIGEIVFLPQLLQFMQQAAPQIGIEAVTLPVREARLAMEAGAVDLAIGFIPDLKAGFYQQRLFEQKYVCMLRQGHAQIGDSVSMKAFIAARHAIVNAEGTGHGMVETMFERAGLAPEMVVRLPHFLAAPMVVAATDLVATVPQKLAEAYAKMLPLRLLPHPLKIPVFQVNQYWHRRYHKDPANQWLRGHFARLFRE
ncbi:MAG TPA: LysR family transcriptional regulator [Burkholderiales bacterium]|jgi:DNA-binding transcriptional LysR family regulator